MNAWPRPRKSLGQHFLTEPRLLERLVEAAEIGPDETVVEVGPGRGHLTERLALRAARVIAIEKDRALYDALREKFAGQGNVDLVYSDALRFSYELLEGPFKVVANLPYAIATELIFRFLGLGARVPRMVLMLQREVAERILAEPGTREYGILSIAVRLAARPTVLFHVAPGSFWPPPRVRSTALLLVHSPHPSTEENDPALILRTARSAFRHRRKQLQNALADEGYPAAQIRRALEKASISGTRRAETLSIEEFCRLAQFLFEPPQRV